MFADELLEHIEKIKASGILVIVEGRKDKAALYRLGITNVIRLNKPLYAIVELVVEKYNKCIILTDLDKKGKELYSKLRHDLTRFGVKIDDTFRKFLFENTDLRQIEGIDTYISNQIRNKKSEHTSSS